uniref:Uncharacterized protein n=1 Tax=Ditylenchus dipsaci TaxID=166011 RepID=A0A915DV27_9BILA
MFHTICTLACSQSSFPSNPYFLAKYLQIAKLSAKDLCAGHVSKFHKKVVLVPVPSSSSTAVTRSSLCSSALLSGDEFKKCA